MAPSQTVLLTVVLAVAVKTCVPTDVVCTSDFRYGIRVTVVDSATGAPPPEATLLASSGAFRDSVGPREPLQLVRNGPPVLILSTAGERPGVYSVTVRSPGYREWTRSRITVTADECHVRPVGLTARLQPA